MRDYEKHEQADGSHIIVEVRGGRKRKVSEDHHSYLDFLSLDGVAVEIPYRAPIVVAPTTEQIKQRAVQENMGEYTAIMARYHALGETTQTEALRPWKDKVTARVAVLAAPVVSKVTKTVG